MAAIFKLYVYLSLLGVGIIGAQEMNRCFHAVYPLNSFKTVIDTCMRSYSDALILQDRIANHDRIDDLLDILVGRLVRLESYIEQLIYAYRYEATVSFDELEYLMHLLEYLEITIAETNYHQVAQGLNSITDRLKKDLKQALGLLSVRTFIPAPLLRYRCPLLINHSYQFA